MNPKEAIVRAGMITAMLMVYRGFRQDQRVRPRNFMGVGTVYLSLMLLAGPAPQVAVPFSWLIPITVLLAGDSLPTFERLAPHTGPELAVRDPRQIADSGSIADSIAGFRP